jgi:hypothetical protein
LRHRENAIVQRERNARQSLPLKPSVKGIVRTIRQIKPSVSHSKNKRGDLVVRQDRLYRIMQDRRSAGTGWTPSPAPGLGLNKRQKDVNLFLGYSHKKNRGRGASAFLGSLSVVGRSNQRSGRSPAPPLALWGLGASGGAMPCLCDSRKQVKYKKDARTASGVFSGAYGSSATTLDTEREGKRLSHKSYFC